MKERGGPGGLAPPVLVDMADRPITKIADITDSILQKAHLKFRVLCFVGDFVFVSLARRVKPLCVFPVFVSLPFAQLRTCRCQNQQI